MSDQDARPLLADADTEAEIESTIVEPSRSRASSRSLLTLRSSHLDESTPLLSRSADVYANGTVTSAAASSLQSLQEGNSKNEPRRRWPTAVALSILSLAFLTILSIGFAAPAVVQEYTKQAMVFEPTDLSIDSFTTAGVRARIRGDFMLDASKVNKRIVRDLGRIGTWLVSAIESKSSKVEVYVPEYGNELLGTAAVPPVVISVRNQVITHVDILTDLEPGDKDGIRQIANDWIEGRLGQLRLLGKANIGLKSGIFGLGTHLISQSLLFEGHDLPTLPKYNITRLNVHEIELPASERGLAADVSIIMRNTYPVTFTVPRLGFEILVPGCSPEDAYILLANATTEEIQVSPNSEISVNVKGIIRRLTNTLTTACPKTFISPLDVLLGNYMNGTENTIYVRGAESPSKSAPDWISDLIKTVTVPLPLPGHNFDGLIRDFALANVHLGLPDPLADPDSPEGKPRISATVKALVGLPEEMNFPIDVHRVRADADVYYHSKKLGVLDLHDWQRANATRIDAHGDVPAGLQVESIVNNAPLNVTDENVFADVIQAMIFGTENVVLGIKAKVDVETETALGKFIVRKLPAEGKVPVKPLSGGGLKTFSPKVGSLKILDTTTTGLSLEAKINITNPTEYTATIPYVNINIFSNGTHLGQAVSKNIDVVPGPNDNIIVHATWDPFGVSGKKGVEAGRELLSQFISGYNTTLGLRTHSGTIPNQPRLGQALSSIEFQIPTPKLHVPKNPNHHDDGDNDDEDDGKPHFIDDATMHLFTSTATFTLLSPLPHTTLFITYINATALYNHTEPVGVMLYELPFAVPPGASVSPRLPVEWSLGSVGYEAVKQALGGTLKLDAEATVGIQIGRWTQRLWYRGSGIGAHVKI